MIKPLTLDLLDNDFRHIIQSWNVDPSGVCQIGRGADVDIRIRNPYVSRLHAYLECTHQGWVLTSISDHGVIVDGKVERLVQINGELEFRLSRKGPLLRLRSQASSPIESADNLATIGEEQYGLPLLLLNTRQRDEEIADIERQDYFKKLQSIATELRNSKTGDS